LIIVVTPYSVCVDFIISPESSSPYNDLTYLLNGSSSVLVGYEIADITYKIKDL